MKKKQSSVLIGLIAAATMAFATAAQATPVRFDNPPGPGHFDWNGTAAHEYLKIFADAASQPGVAGATGTFRRRDIAALGSTEVRGAASSSSLQYVVLPGGSPGPANFLVGVDLGTLISSPVVPGTLDGFTIPALIWRGDAEAGFPQTNLPEGLETYLGVRFDLGAGQQYGWIGIVRTGTQLDTFAWGYETEAGVPIPAGAPEPGTVALLAFGAVGAITRRRRPRA